MQRNPWLDLPTKPPFVLPDDWEIIEKFNLKSKNKNFILEIEMLPEPFSGSLDAPVVILLENPGAGAGADDFALHKLPSFRRRVRACHRQEVVPYPLHFVEPTKRQPKGKDGPGACWTKEKVLKELLEDFGPRVVGSGVVLLEYFPYHSKNFSHSRVRLPSQDFTFQALQRAIDREATIIITRGQRIWTEAVPDLADYRLAFTTSWPQTASISRNNCRFASIAYGENEKPGKGRPSGYEAAQAALRKIDPRLLPQSGVPKGY